MNETRRKDCSEAEAPRFPPSQPSINDSMQSICQRLPTGISSLDPQLAFAPLPPQLGRGPGRSKTAYLYLQNCMDSPDVFDFRQLFVFPEVVLLQNHRREWSSHRCRAARVKFGRGVAPAADAWAVTMPSTLCSRSHFEIGFEGLFEASCFPPTLYAVLKTHWRLRSPRVVRHLAQFFGKRGAEEVGTIAEQGSCVGTWLGVRGNSAQMAVGAHFYVQDSVFFEVLGVFHREGASLFKEEGAHRLERREITAQNSLMLQSDLQCRLRKMVGIHINSEYFEPRHFSNCLARLWARDAKFSLLALSITYSATRKKEDFGFFVVGAEAFALDLNGLVIDFRDKVFRVGVAAAAEEAVPVLWQAVGGKKGERFAPGERPLPNDSFVMVENAVLRVSGRSF